MTVVWCLSHDDKRHRGKLAHLHFATLADDDVEVRHVFASVARSCAFHLLHDIEAFHNFAKYDVLFIKKRRGDSRDEELAPVCIGPGILSWRGIYGQHLR